MDDDWILVDSMPVPTPADCRDPERLKRVEPGTIHLWLQRNGWHYVERWDGIDCFERQGGWPVVLRDGLGLTAQTLRILGDALNLWPGQVLAELEMTQRDLDKD